MTPAEYAGIVVRELLAAGAAEVRARIAFGELTFAVRGRDAAVLGGGEVRVASIEDSPYADGRARIHAAEIASKCGLPGVPK